MFRKQLCFVKKRRSRNSRIISSCLQIADELWDAPSRHSLRPCAKPTSRYKGKIYKYLGFYLTPAVPSHIVLVCTLLEGSTLFFFGAFGLFSLLFYSMWSCLFIYLLVIYNSVFLILCYVSSTSIRPLFNSEK